MSGAEADTSGWLELMVGKHFCFACMQACAIASVLPGMVPTLAWMGDVLFGAKPQHPR